MQKWEYLFLSCEYHNNDWRPRFVNGQEVQEGKPWAEMTVYDFSNMIGERGWELVDFMVDRNPIGTHDLFRLIFKRPKAE
jgi:hypothetical protein